MNQKPIDRNNLEDVLKQIGRTEKDIQHINRKIGNIDKEINRWPKRLECLKTQKYKAREMISKKHKYINELETDLKRLNDDYNGFPFQPVDY